jgi:hypothetical protein
MFQAEIAALMKALSGFPAEYLHTEGQERRELSKYIREAPTPEWHRDAQHGSAYLESVGVVRR